MSKFRKPTRWTIADLLNRLPWVCWADVVDWVHRAKEAPSRNSSQRLLRTSGDGDTYGILRMNRTRDCRADAARTGTCYCGKFATAEAKIQCGLDSSIVVEAVEP
jgi:hypothetical protein